MEFSLIKKPVFLLIAFCWSVIAQSQQLKSLEDSLSRLSAQFVSSPESNVRKEAFSDFVSLMKVTLKMGGSFEYSFDSLKSVSILYAPDSAFRIFTAQTQFEGDLYRHFGALQWRNDPASPVVFNDQSENIQNQNSEILDPDHWYGALYYNLVPFEAGGEGRFLLFGYDSFSRYHKRKLIDVLTVNDHNLVFGSPVFEWENQLLTRFIWQYSADVKVHLNFDVNHHMIIFDNLIPMKGLYLNQGVVMVPDGSYTGLKFQDDKWIQVDRIFFEILEEPPLEFPVLNEDEIKDLFGRPRKG